MLGLRNETHTWARFGPNDISTWARTRSSPTPGNSVYAHGLTRAITRRSGGQGVASSNLASPTLFALVRARPISTGSAGRGSRGVSRGFHATPARAAPSPVAAGVVDLHRVPEESAASDPVVSPVRCIVRASVWRTLWSRTTGTSAVRHNTAKRSDYASGPTGVPSASTSTRPVLGTQRPGRACPRPDEP